MTELAPVGYVGVSPRCLLGFNKVHNAFVHETQMTSCVP